MALDNITVARRIVADWAAAERPFPDSAFLEDDTLAELHAVGANAVSMLRTLIDELQEANDRADTVAWEQEKDISRQMSAVAGYSTSRAVMAALREIMGVRGVYALKQLTHERNTARHSRNALRRELTKVQAQRDALTSPAPTSAGDPVAYAVYGRASGRLKWVEELDEDERAERAQFYDIVPLYRCA